MRRPVSIRPALPAVVCGHHFNGVEFEGDCVFLRVDEDGGSFGGDEEVVAVDAEVLEFAGEGIGRLGGDVEEADQAAVVEPRFVRFGEDEVGDFAADFGDGHGVAFGGHHQTEAGDDKPSGHHGEDEAGAGSSGGVGWAEGHWRFDDRRGGGAHGISDAGGAELRETPQFVSFFMMEGCRLK